MQLSEVKKIVVVGAGTMGHSIAQVFAQGGFQVSLVDTQENILDKALGLIKGNIKTLSDFGLVNYDDIDAIMGRIFTSSSIEEGCQEADVAVEAVYEAPELKRSIFAELDRFCPERTILTSNTSTLDVYGIVETGRPDKVVIAHWFAPPHIIPLVEVVQGEETSSETIDLVSALLKKVGKKPVYIKQFMPGFIVNRIQMGIISSVLEILDNDWATPAQIDLAVKASISIRLPILGPVQTLDFTGLDLVKAVSDQQEIPSNLVNEKVDQGHLGAKTGKGLYEYQGRSYEEILRKRDERYLKLIRFLEDLKTDEPI